MHKCKITVVKRTINRNLIDEYLDDKNKEVGPCECFREDQELIVDPSMMPEQFWACCAWALADIRKDIIAIAHGADMQGMKQRGPAITGCTDWLRPVVFKVERMGNA